MYYPEETVEEVRAANDIVDVISSYIQLQKKGNSYFGLCPFHNEKTPSFSVSRSKQMYYCFGCGAGGNVISFVMQYENYSFEEALKYLADRVGIKLPEIKQSADDIKNRDIRTKLYEINKITAEYYFRNLGCENGKSAYKYLKGRALSDDIIRHFGLGYSLKQPDDVYKMLRDKGYDDDILKESGLCTIEEKGSRDKFWNRVMFPIMDINNKVIAFGGRVMGEGEPKYLNSPETKLFDKSRNLYGLNYARRTRKDFFLLCEGYMDVISLHQAGYTNAVASLGTAFTDGHATLIKRYVNKVVITYDSDGAGEKAARRAIPILQAAGIQVKILDMKPYKDPDEFIKALGADEYEKRIKAAENAFLWELSSDRKQYDIQDPEQKTAFEHHCAEKLSRFSEPLERDNYTRSVAVKFMVPYENLKALVSTIRPVVTSSGYSSADVEIKRSIRKRSKDEGLLKTQRFLLSSIAEDNSLYFKVKAYISPEDFDDDLYQQIADMLFNICKEQKESISSIVDRYINEPELQKEVVKILSNPEQNESDEADRMSALSSAIKRIKLAGFDKKSKEANDIESLQKIITEQAEWKNKTIQLTK